MSKSVSFSDANELRYYDHNNTFPAKNYVMCRPIYTPLTLATDDLPSHHKLTLHKALAVYPIDALILDESEQRIIGVVEYQQIFALDMPISRAKIMNDLQTTGGGSDSPSILFEGVELLPAIGSIPVVTAMSSKVAQQLVQAVMKTENIRSSGDVYVQVIDEHEKIREKIARIRVGGFKFHIDSKLFAIAYDNGVIFPLICILK